MILIIVFAYLVLSIVLMTYTAATTLVESPSNEKWYQSFETRLDMGNHVLLISSKPSIKWEEPEAYFDVGSMEVEPESIFCTELWS